MYQSVEIIGNLGRDPEMRYMPNGSAVTNFSVATTSRYTDKNTGEIVEKTVWWRVAAWNRLAETCNQYLSSGRQVFVVGELEADPETGGPKIWTRGDGSPGASFELRANTVKFLGSRGAVELGDDDSESSAPAAPAPAPKNVADEIPF